MSRSHTVETLDARGLLCPMPVIKAQDRIADLRPGTLLDVLVTDPGRWPTCRPGAGCMATRLLRLRRPTTKSASG